MEQSLQCSGLVLSFYNFSSGIIPWGVHIDQNFELMQSLCIRCKIQKPLGISADLYCTYCCFGP